ncbi:MAG TPA: hypothetical protein V6C84_16190 [Coleofasciculaceae cyanobacterium]|jgi:hypothetical protein
MKIAKLIQHRLFYKGIQGVEDGRLILNGDQHELLPGTLVEILEEAPGETPETSYALCRYPAKEIPGVSPSHEWMPVTAFNIIEEPAAAIV